MRDSWISGLWRDVRVAGRRICKSPMVSGAVGVSLALGIGANVSIYAFVAAVVLRGVPYPNSERVYAIENVATGQGQGPLRGPSLQAWRSGSQVFEALAGYQLVSAEVTAEGGREFSSGAEVTFSFFDVFRVPAAYGRVLSEDEEGPQQTAIVLSHSLAIRRFGEAQRAVGRSVQINRRSYVVVGVMPPSFGVPSRSTDWWAPIPLTSTGLRIEPNRVSVSPVSVIGKLSPGQSVAAARAEGESVLSRPPAASLGSRPPQLEFTLFRDVLVGPVGRVLLAAQAITLALMCLVCANVGVLMLAESSSRRREMEVRAALGATRLHLIRQVVVESTAVSLLGSTAGGAVGYLAVRVLQSKVGFGSGAGMPNVAGGWEVGVTTVLVSLAIGGMSIAWPALTLIAPARRGSVGGGTSTRVIGRGQSARRTLVVLESAALVVLLAAGGILLQGLLRALTADTGFTRARVWVAEIWIPPGKYEGIVQRINMVRELQGVMAANPDLGSSGFASTLPFSRAVGRVDVEPLGSMSQAALSEADLTFATPEYMDALGLRPVLGRGLSLDDVSSSPGVAVINRSAAGTLNPEGSVLHTSLRVARERTVEIVGVIGDVKMETVFGTTRPTVYLPLAQVTAFDNRMPAPRWLPALYVAVPDVEQPRAVLLELQRAVARVDPELAVVAPGMLGERVAASLALTFSAAALVVLCGALAIVVAGVGVYGTVAFWAEQRRREIGIRMALGATGRRVRATVLAEAAVWIGVGVGVGGSIVWAFGDIPQKVIYGPHIAKEGATVAAIIVVACVGLMGGLVPAIKAARLDPLEALRSDDT